MPLMERHSYVYGIGQLLMTRQITFCGQSWYTWLNARNVSPDADLVQFSARSKVKRTFSLSSCISNFGSFSPSAATVLGMGVSVETVTGSASIDAGFDIATMVSDKLDETVSATVSQDDSGEVPSTSSSLDVFVLGGRASTISRPAFVMIQSGGLSWI